jgi:hypothetical protein
VEDTISNLRCGVFPGIHIGGRSFSSKSITLSRANADIVAPEEPTATILDATNVSRIANLVAALISFILVSLC